MDDIKAGWKTSEFWLTLLSTLITAAIALGLLPATEGENLKTGITALVTGIFMIIPVGMYIWGRVTVKRVTIEGEATVQAAAESAK